MRVAVIYGAFGASFLVLMGAWGLIFEVDSGSKDDRDQKASRHLDARTAPVRDQASPSTAAFPMTVVRRGRKDITSDFKETPRTTEAATPAPGTPPEPGLTVAGPSAAQDILEALGLKTEEFGNDIETLVDEYRKSHDRITTQYRQERAAYRMFGGGRGDQTFDDTPGAQDLHRELQQAREKFVSALQTLTFGDPRAAQMTEFLPHDMN